MKIFKRCLRVGGILLGLFLTISLITSCLNSKTDKNNKRSDDGVDPIEGVDFIPEYRLSTEDKRAAVSLCQALRTKKYVDEQNPGFKIYTNKLHVYELRYDDEEGNLHEHDEFPLLLGFNSENKIFEFTRYNSTLDYKGEYFGQLETDKQGLFVELCGPYGFDLNFDPDEDIMTNWFLDEVHKVRIGFELSTEGNKVSIVIQKTNLNSFKAFEEHRLTVLVTDDVNIGKGRILRHKRRVFKDKKKTHLIAEFKKMKDLPQ